ncbi:MAG: DUF2267 domain-containing protein [Candidatus Dojkabacteria bacterium]
MTQQTGLKNFDKTLNETNNWLKDLEEILQTEDRQSAYHALKGVLHALRDRLTPVEAAELAAQMPMLMRGMFYEGWKPVHKPEKIRSLDQFFKKVEIEMAPTSAAFNADEATRAVFYLLQKHISAGEMKDVRSIIPDTFNELWVKA